MRNRVRQLDFEWRSLSQAERDNTEEGKALARRIRALNSELIEQEETLGRWTGGGGNYLKSRSLTKDNCLNYKDKSPTTLVKVVVGVILAFAFINRNRR